MYHDKIGILLTTEQFLEDDVDEVKGDIFPFLLNNNLFQRENEERGPPIFVIVVDFYILVLLFVLIFPAN